MRERTETREGEEVINKITEENFLELKDISCQKEGSTRASLHNA